MMAKCFALLAVFSQISFAVCNCNSDCTTTAPFETTSSGCVVSTPGAPNFEISRASFAKGKYPVALSNCGGPIDGRVPVTTSLVNAPAQEKPTLRMPYTMPAPRVISHTCTCYKTILRPRVHQQIITVPVFERYIQNAHKPVVEQIQYEGLATNCGGSNDVNSNYEFLEFGPQAPAQFAVAQDAAPVCAAPLTQIPSCAAAPVPQFSACSAAPVPQFSACSAAPVPQFSACSAAPVPQFSACSAAPVPQFSACSAAPVPQFSACSPAPVSQIPACSAAPLPQFPAFSPPPFPQACEAPVQTIEVAQAPQIQMPNVQVFEFQNAEAPKACDLPKFSSC